MAARWPDTLVGSATHDTKRGPDVRARLLALTEEPDAWADAVERFASLETETRPAGVDAPDPNAAWLVWQTLVGAWPLDPAEHEAYPQRVRDYVVKAARESKQGTSWTQPKEAYEGALTSLVDRALDPDGELRGELETWVERIAWPGAVSGIALALLAIAGPGVPDVYQGSERWALSLVDPDNRRPVDFRALQAGLDAATPEGLLQSWRDGRLKQHVVHRALGARRGHPDLFARGSYGPIDAGADVLAFVREHDGMRAVCAVPRNPLRRAAEPVVLPVAGATGAAWRDALTGDELDEPVAFRRLPAALLIGGR